MTKPGRNDPCPCGSGKKFKHCHVGKADDIWSRPEPAIHRDPVTGYPGYPTHSGVEVDPALFDADEDEYWEDAVNDLPPPPPYTKLDEAWEVVDEAWYEPNPKKRARLAKEAIELSSDCCGAYIILAGLETSLDARLARYEQANTAAERALAPHTLAEIARNDQSGPDVEHALYALLHSAITLVALRRSDKGIAILQHLIEVDPSDRYDARLQLVLLLMADEQLDAAAEVERVSTRASSSSSLWAFARALLKFQREGDSVFARRALAEAIILYPEETEVFHNAFDAIADLGSNETSGSDHPDPVHTRVYQELVRKLSLLLSMDGAPLDPVDDRATLVAIAASTTLWLAVAGASAWFLAVRAEGPAVRYDNRRLGDGTLLSITIDKLTKCRHCPHCHKPTKFHPTHLALHLEDGPIIDFEGNARVCESCDVVCIAVENIARQIIMQRPEAYGRDFISLGFIPESERGSGSGADWLSEHARPWRQIDDYDSFREDWPTIESQLHELDSLLHSSGITGLLGPMSHR